MKEFYREQLFTAFTIKVKEFHKDHFNQNPEYSGDFENDKSKDHFGRALKEHFEKEINQKNSFNHRTFITMINNRISKNAHLNSLNNISQFIGYRDFQDFVNQIPKKKMLINRKKVVITVGLSLLFVIPLFGYYLLFSFDRKIHKIITEANQAQFEAYQTLPLIKTNDLKKYYTENGSAFKVIEDILVRSAELNRVINQPLKNASHYTLQNIKIIERRKDKVIVETQEHWYLRWFCLNTHSYIKKYDESNSQIYILKKQNGLWKIDSNDFEGTAEYVKK